MVMMKCHGIGAFSVLFQYLQIDVYFLHLCYGIQNPQHNTSRTQFILSSSKETAPVLIMEVIDNEMFTIKVW